jgi:hypothetical protein
MPTSLAVGRSPGSAAVQAWMRYRTSCGHSSGTDGSGRLPRVTGMMPVTICPRAGRASGVGFSGQCVPPCWCLDVVHTVKTVKTQSGSLSNNCGHLSGIWQSATADLVQHHAHAEDVGLQSRRLAQDHLRRCVGEPASRRHRQTCSNAVQSSTPNSTNSLEANCGSSMHRPQGARRLTSTARWTPGCQGRQCVRGRCRRSWRCARGSAARCGS